jgi:guanylate kinase
MDSVESINFDIYHPQPLLVVISGPSGVGKDAVLQLLKRRQRSLFFVVTATSRAPRAGEVHGVDYFFISDREFERMIEAGELIEYALVYDQYKGVPKEQVRQSLLSGKDVVMRVDVQGAAKMRQLYPDALLIFLVPGTEAEWHKRLLERKTETEESLRLRVATARQELDCVSLFDYVVVNAQDRLSETVDVIEHIIEAEHHRIPQRCIANQL